MSDDQQRVPQDDLDSLFADHQDGGIDFPDDVAQALGAAADVLGPFAIHAREVLTVGLESVAGKQVRLAGATGGLAVAAAIQSEFEAIPHAGFEVKVAVSPTEAYVVAVLVPAEDLGTLFTIEMSPEQLTDATFAASQVEAVSGSLRELLDLVSLTLLGEHLAGVEATLASARFGQVNRTIGTVSATAAGAPMVTIDLLVSLPEEVTARILLVVPVALLARCGALMGAEDDEAAPAVVEQQDDEGTEPTPLRAASRAPSGRAERSAEAGDAPGFGLIDGGGEWVDAGNVSPLRPAGMFGATTGDDVDVHPVRFPPLPEHQSAVAQRSMDLIMDVSMRVTVELGRSTMTVEDVLSLGPGSVVELNKLAGEPVDILVNDQLIARGEVVVVDENFGVRVTEIVSPRRRAHAMGA